MAELHQARPPGAAHDSRSAGVTLGDVLPPRYYDPARAHREPEAVTAARKRHRAINEQIERARAQAAEDMPDPEPGYEWYRELAEDAGDD